MTDLKGKAELFNMKKDPFATKNIINEHPEAKKQHEDFYDEWFKSLDKEYPNMWTPHHIKVGTKYEPETMLTRQEMRLNEGQKLQASVCYLDFVESNNYKISFLTNPIAKNVKAELLLNGKVVQTKSFINQAQMSFDPLKISAGKTEFRIMLKADKKATIPWHIFIKK